jgi:hypothetical protein
MPALSKFNKPAAIVFGLYDEAYSRGKKQILTFLMKRNLKPQVNTWAYAEKSVKLVNAKKV